MCHLGVEGTFGSRSKVFVRSDDVDRADVALSTLELSRKLTREHENVDFFFVIGSDLIGNLTTWRHSAELLEECHFLVHPRPGQKESLLDPKIKATMLRAPGSCTTKPATIALTLMSSTEVRHRATLADGDLDRFETLLEGLVPPLVKTFILRYRLYLD